MIYNYLNIFAEGFCDEAKDTADANEFSWNPSTARFEIDIYFAFLLSFSMQGHKQDNDACSEMTAHCYYRLLKRYSPLLISDNLSKVIDERMENFVSCTNDNIKKGKRTHEMVWIECLSNNLIKSVDNRVGHGAPLMIVGIMGTIQFRLLMLFVQLAYASKWLCVLNELFKSTGDFRNLNNIDELVEIGSEKGDEFEKNNYERIANIIRSAIRDFPYPIF
jgi:hypothetical protein